MEFIYKKEADLDDQNNFLVDLVPKNEVDGNYFKGKEEYLISGIEIKPEVVDFTKWSNFSIIKQISDRLNKAKKNKENEINHAEIQVYLPNVNDFDSDILVANDPTKRFINISTSIQKNRRN